jgi:acyl-CoA dehydrogenase
MWHLQLALDGVIRNFPLRPVAWLMYVLVFPFGRREVPPSDRLGRRVAALLTAPNEARDRLLQWTSLAPSPNNAVARLNALLPDVVAAEPVERKFLKALKGGQVKAHDYAAQLDEAQKLGAISAEEHALLARVHEASAEFIAVDDFSSEELRAAVVRDKSASRKLHVA